MQRILFAVTSHGLGHLTRTLAIARELRERSPGVQPMISTTIPESRVEVDLPPPFAYRSAAYEPGIIQKNCFEIDEPGTRNAYLTFLDQREERLREEEWYLRERGCTAVVADIPGLAVRAASRVGIPAIGIGNFTWDWLLAPLCEGAPYDRIPDALARDYALGTHHLMLPFGPLTSPFPSHETAPLVSRRARLGADEVLGRLGLESDVGERLVVVCPGGWSADDWPPIHVSGCAGTRFLTVGDLPITADAPIRALPHDLPSGIIFPDLVAAADAVIAKPGYGIASECATHRTALVAIERPGFRETPVLLEAFRRIGPVEELSLDDFFSGRWEAALRAVREQTPTWAGIPEDGLGRIVERLGELLGLPIQENPGRS